MAAGVKLKVDRFREENPDFFDTWPTKYGHVVQFWGMRVYYGACQECGGLVTTRRKITGYKEGQTLRGLKT